MATPLMIAMRMSLIILCFFMRYYAYDSKFLVWREECGKGLAYYSAKMAFIIAADCLGGYNEAYARYAKCN